MKSMTKKIKSLSKLSVIFLVLLFSIFGFLFYRKYFFHSVSIRGAGNDLGQFSYKLRMEILFGKENHGNQRKAFICF